MFGLASNLFHNFCIVNMIINVRQEIFFMKQEIKNEHLQFEIEFMMEAQKDCF